MARKREQLTDTQFETVVKQLDDRAAAEAEALTKHLEAPFTYKRNAACNHGGIKPFDVQFVRRLDAVTCRTCLAFVARESARHGFYDPPVPPVVYLVRRYMVFVLADTYTGRKEAWRIAALGGSVEALEFLYFEPRYNIPTE